MNFKSRNLSDLIILLLLPAPATGLLLILVSVYVIASGSSNPLSKDDTVVEAAPAPTRTLSPNAEALATLSVAPVREVAASSAGGAEVALIDVGYDPATVARGNENFLAICSACHGTDAKGISGLGKTLIGSEFVRANTDQQLLEFVIVGRNIWDPGNTTGVAMPARGGNPGLTDADILTIIAYIRTIDGFTPEGGAITATTPSETTGADTTTASTEPQPTPDTSFTPIMTIGSGESSETSTETSTTDTAAPTSDGEVLFNRVCGVSYGGGATVCDYVEQELAAGKTPEEIITVLKGGLSAFAAGNTLGINIPAGAALPPLSDDELNAFVSFIAGGAEAAPAEGDSATPTEDTSATPAEDTATTPASDGEALFNRVCGVTYGGGVTVCDYVAQELAAGKTPEEIITVLKNGLSAFAAGNTLGINIPAGATLPPLNDSELQTLVEYVASQNQ